MTLDLVPFRQVDGNVGKEDAVLAYFQAHHTDPGASKKSGDVISTPANKAFEEGLFGAFLRSSGDPFAICSPVGVVERLNPAAERLFGYNAREIDGHKFASLLMPAPAD